MAKMRDLKKDEPLQQQPEENSLEKEIEEIIDSEKTMRRIVNKMLSQPNAKNR
jgi:hypothetical protein